MQVFADSRTKGVGVDDGVTIARGSVGFSGHVIGVDNVEMVVGDVSKEIPDGCQLLEMGGDDHEGLRTAEGLG